MEELKHLTKQRNGLQLSKALEKIAKGIAEQKKDTSKKELAIEELNFLKEQCLSNNVQLSLLSAQTLYGLVENGVLDPANVLTMFMAMLSNANTSMKISAVGEGIINILLMDLKIACRQLKGNDTYACPFGMKNAQHPIITLIQKKNVDILDLANKLDGICTHFDEHVNSNSIEFLRPVFLHVFCNPIEIVNANSMWLVLLKQQKLNPSRACGILHEMFAWCRITPERCLSLSMQIVQVIELFLEMNDIDAALQYQVYLTSLILSMIEFGHDPRNALRCIFNVIHRSSIDDVATINFILITMSQIIHKIAPFYLRSAIDIVKILVDRKGVTDVIVRNMVLDSLIVRLAINGKSIPPQTANDIERLIKKLRKPKPDSNTEVSRAIDNNIMATVKYFDPSIAMNLNLAQLATIVCVELKSSQTQTLKRLIDFARSNQRFANELHFFLRSTLLSIEDRAPLEMWTDLLKLLLENARANPNVSCDTIYFVLYLLAKETDGHKQLKLLRGLTTFATMKENVPLILNTYRSLAASSASKGALKLLSVDLHTRLWLAENRTYQFLHKVLITDEENMTAVYKWEMNIAKSNAIKEICLRKASQHGTDLVAPLSKILNSSIDNDLARSLALDAVTLLCRSHTVNIVSTWNVLKTAFQSKFQQRTLKSLSEFFGEVPLLKSSSAEYDLLFREALNHLWKLITESTDVEVMRSAFLAFRNFDFTELTLKHMPTVFYESIRLPREYQLEIAASHSDPNKPPLTAADVVPYVPGDCWIELLKSIHPDALNDAIEFVTALIESEMCQYRSGVYMLQDGRPEPKELQHLHGRSPLQALVKFLIVQSTQKADTQTILKCLECVSQKYSRPIPPLNWFFLIEFINQGTQFENCHDDQDVLKMKKFALRIAANQIAHSGSAKTLIENYLQSFNASVKSPDEIQMAVELIASISDGIAPQILAPFLRSTLDFVCSLSASSHFEEKCHFELAIGAISTAFDRKCLVPENIDIITDEISRFNDVLNGDLKIYEKYSEFILKLPSEQLDRLTTPIEWTNEEFRKALLVRSKAVAAQKPFPVAPNPWMWTNLLIDNTCDSNDSIADNQRKEALLMQLHSLLMHCNDDVTVSDWIMYFLGKVQSNFNQSKDSRGQSLFALDVFVFSLVVIAGCAAFVDNELGTANRLQWLDKLPESLWLLSKQPHWNVHLPRMFEFLYHLNTQQTYLPKEYRRTIRNTLICVKNNEYFLQKMTWNKFISLK